MSFSAPSISSMEIGGLGREGGGGEEIEQRKQKRKAKDGDKGNTIERGEKEGGKTGKRALKNGGRERVIESDGEGVIERDGEKEREQLQSC